MIRIVSHLNIVEVLSDPGDLAARHQNQLAFWGFSQISEGRFEAPVSKAPDVIGKLIPFFDKASLEYELDEKITTLLENHKGVSRRLMEAARRGREFKNAKYLEPAFADFPAFASKSLKRPLKEHQLKSALHLLSVENGANFSVPGSGKTSVILAVFEWLRSRGEVDALFVVGPPACFGPWKNEYKTVLGRAPVSEVLAGGDIDSRHSKYFVDAKSAADIYLTTFQTLQRDWEHVQQLFESQGIRFFLVVDEAHYIKQLNGAWATAILGIARYAVRRCILTGTPFPRSYEDGFNLFDVLWPDSPPLSGQQRLRIIASSEKQDWEAAASVIEESVGPLFYRVRKTDLKLAPQIIHQPIVVQMNAREQLVYDAVLDRVQTLSTSDEYRNFDLLERLRRGRMIRLRQCLSYVPLLTTAVTEYSEEIVTDDMSLSDLIKHYDQMETPGKIQRLLALVRDLLSKSEKVVIWSNFVKTLELIQATMESIGVGVRLIYGATPIEDRSFSDELTREKIVEEFVDPESAIRVLVANPAACAESISLHKACCNAIYYDLSYNCAQYVQSMDRIHRVGGSELRPSHYYFLQYARTIDKNILLNVQRKAEKMNRIIDREFPVYTLDMFAGDEELEAYEQLFGKRKPV